jgi:[acyl-carrier-protein] S-malonyltransferase
MRAAAAMADGATFVELGPGGVLGGLVKRIVPGAGAVSLGTADEVNAFLDRAAAA